MAEGSLSAEPEVKPGPRAARKLLSGFVLPEDLLYAELLSAPCVLSPRVSLLFASCSRRRALTCLHSVTQISDAIVRGFNLAVLTQNNLLQRRRQLVLHCLLKFFYSGVFATFAFCQDCMLIAARDRRFQIDPAAM